jgi:hypothetical protein
MFTTAQLVATLNHTDLNTWAATNLQNQAQHLNNFSAHFAAIQTWITQNGGDNPFGWDSYGGLTHNNLNPVNLTGNNGRISAFNDAFNDVRKFLNTPNFRLFQAAEAIIRLRQVLTHMN